MKCEIAENCNCKIGGGGQANPSGNNPSFVPPPRRKKKELLRYLWHVGMCISTCVYADWGGWNWMSYALLSVYYCMHWPAKISPSEAKITHAWKVFIDPEIRTQPYPFASSRRKSANSLVGRGTQQPVAIYQPARTSRKSDLHTRSAIMAAQYSPTGRALYGNDRIFHRENGSSRSHTKPVTDVCEVARRMKL